MKYCANCKEILDKPSLKYLYHKWGYMNLALEIKTDEGGRLATDPDERFMAEYTLATVNKRRFINYIQRASYEKKGLTMQEIVKLVNCTRKAVETMIKELKPLKVIDQEKNKDGHYTYKASPKLMKFHQNYTDWMLKTSIEIGIRNTATAILELENLGAEPDTDDVKLLRI